MKFEPAEGVVFIGCTCGFIKERILGRRIADAFGDPNTTALVTFFRAGDTKECHYLRHDRRKRSRRLCVLVLGDSWVIGKNLGVR